MLHDDDGSDLGPGGEVASPAPISGVDTVTTGAGFRQLDKQATLADVLAAIEAAPASNRREVEMRSAIRRMGDVLHLPLATIPADPTRLRVLVSAASRASAGLTKERWSRIRSLTFASLRDVGIDVEPGRDIAGASPAWKVRIATLGEKSLGVRLSRFASHCTRNGIEPEAVEPETFDSFRAALNARSLKANPEAIYRETVRAWNQAATSQSDWPQVVVALERHPRFFSLEWGAFPPSLVADVEAFLAHSGSSDVLDPTNYARSVKPSTVELRRRQIKQLLSALVLSGYPIDQIVKLAVLVNNAEAALRYQHSRMGKVTSSLGQQTWLLRTIARYWVKSPDRSDALAVIGRQINVKPIGMTPRNRERLRQFDHPSNLSALLNLPQKIFAQAQRDKVGDSAEARRVALSLAVEFLLVAPMRIGNLVGLEPARHIVRFGRGTRVNRHIVIPAHETKNGEMFEVVLPAESGELLDLYLETYRPRLCAFPSKFLFPTIDGEMRGKISFSKALSDFVEQETGLKMHAHLFRSLAGKIVLKANPNALETVRRILGHRSINTTSRYYVEAGTSQAFLELDRTIAAIRASESNLQPVRPRKPRGAR